MVRKKKNIVRRVETVVVKQQPSRRKSKPRRRNRGGKSSSMSNQASHLNRALANPWYGNACIPDGSANVGCFSVKETGQLTVGTTSKIAAIFVTPDLNIGLYVKNGAVGVSAGNIDIPGNWVVPTKIATIDNMFKRFRPVSLGLRITYTGPTLNDQGSILYGRIPSGFAANDFNNAAAASVGNSLLSDFAIRRASEGCEITWLPSDMVEMSEFKVIVTTGSITSTTGYGLSGIMAVAYGLDSTTAVFNYEIVANYEGQYEGRNLYVGQSLGAAPVEPAWYEKALNFANKVVGNVDAGKIISGVRTASQVYSAVRMMDGRGLMPPAQGRRLTNG